MDYNTIVRAGQCASGALEKIKKGMTAGTTEEAREGKVARGSGN